MKTAAILLIVAHFVGDWFAQPRWMAESKSSSWSVLLFHLLLITVAIQLIYGNAAVCFKLVDTSHLVRNLGVNALLHGLIDWNIWRLYTRIRGDDAIESFHTETSTWNTSVHARHVRMVHDYPFYATIALDQTLHLVVLLALFL